MPFKNLLIVAVFIFLATCTKLSSASTKLEIAEAFNIKAVNGVSYSSGLLNQNRELNLRAGLNHIAIEYEEVFDDEDDDNFDIVKSNVFLLKLYLEKDTFYKQRFIKPHDASAAKRYILNPVFEIVKVGLRNKKNKSINFDLLPLSSNESNFVIASTRLRRNATLNLSHPDTRTNKPSGIHNSFSEGNIQNTNGQSTASKMLQYWWQQATPEERAMFLKSINSEN